MSEHLHDLILRVKIYRKIVVVKNFDKKIVKYY